MSDGPHRSLPMRPAWKRVAECGDNSAFAADEVARALVPALEQDARDELSPQFIVSFCGLYGSLFKDQFGTQLEALRSSAGAGLERALVDHAMLLAATGETGGDAPEKAMKHALTDRAARGARQVEEHYLREAAAPRAHKVRDRIEAAIGASEAAIEALSRRALKLDSGPAPQPTKQQGLDEGVRL